MKDRVLCHSGYKYAQEPRVILWQQERLPIEQVLAHRQTPSGPGFTVLVTDGRRFDLHYHQQLDEWVIEPA